MALEAITIVILLIMVAGLGLVVKRRNQRTAIWSGMIIGVTALVASFFVSMLDKSGYTSTQLTFLVNSYLVAASVGANIFASAIVLQLEPSGPLFPKRRESQDGG